MLELGAVIMVVYAIEEMARARRLKYKIWFSTAILGWLLTALLRVFTPFPLAFAVIGWLLVISMFLYLYMQKAPKRKLSEREERQERELNELFTNVEPESSQDK